MLLPTLLLSPSVSPWIMDTLAVGLQVGPDEHHGQHLTDKQGFWPAQNYIPTIGPENVNSDRQVNVQRVRIYL